MSEFVIKLRHDTTIPKTLLCILKRPCLCASIMYFISKTVFLHLDSMLHPKIPTTPKAEKDALHTLAKQAFS